MKADMIQTFIDLGVPVRMVWKNSRFSAHVNGTLSHIDGKFVATTDGQHYRIRDITSIGRADALDHLKKAETPCQTD